MPLRPPRGISFSTRARRTGHPTVELDPRIGADSYVAQGAEEVRHARTFARRRAVSALGAFAVIDSHAGLPRCQLRHYGGWTLG